MNNIVSCVHSILNWFYFCSSLKQILVICMYLFPFTFYNTAVSVLKNQYRILNVLLYSTILLKLNNYGYLRGHPGFKMDCKYNNKISRGALQILLRIIMFSDTFHPWWIWIHQYSCIKKIIPFVLIKIDLMFYSNLCEIKKKFTPTQSSLLSSHYKKNYLILLYTIQMAITHYNLKNS